MIESNSEGAVDNPAVDVHTKVDFHDILLLEDNIFLTRVRRVMCDLMVEIEPGGETDAGFEAVSWLQSWVTQQRPYAILNSFSDAQERLTGFDAVLYPPTNLAVSLRCLAVILEEDVVSGMKKSLVACFGGCRLISRKGLDFSLRIFARGKKVAQQDPGW